MSTQPALSGALARLRPITRGDANNPALHAERMNALIAAVHALASGENIRLPRGFKQSFRGGVSLDFDLRRSAPPALDFAFRTWDASDVSGTKVSVRKGRVNQVAVPDLQDTPTRLAATTLSIANPALIVLKVKWVDEDSDLVESATLVAIEGSDEPPPDSDLYWHVPIAAVEFSADKISRIVQRQMGDVSLHRRRVFDFPFRARFVGENLEAKITGGLAIPLHSGAPGASTLSISGETNLGLGSVWALITHNGSAFTGALTVLPGEYSEKTGFFFKLSPVSPGTFATACSTETNPAATQPPMLRAPGSSDTQDLRGYAIPIADIGANLIRQRHFGDILYDNLAALWVDASASSAPACTDLIPRTVSVCVDGKECTMVVLGTTPACSGGGSDTSPPPETSSPPETSGP